MSRPAPPARLGVLGGTFDPVHFGHLRAAEEIADLFGLERVMLVPAAQNPLRRGAAGASPEARLEMARLAVEGNPRLLAADLEVRRGGPSYTIDTLEELAGRLPETALVLAMGADAWREFGSWRRSEAVLLLADIAVMTRPGSPAPDFPGGLLAPLPPALRSAYRPEGGLLRHPSGRTIAAAPVTPLDISATRVRALAASGKSLRYLVPDAVAEYIAGRGLYRGEQEGRA